MYPPSRNPPSPPQPLALATARLARGCPAMLGTSPETCASPSFGFFPFLSPLPFFSPLPFLPLASSLEPLSLASLAGGAATGAATAASLGVSISATAASAAIPVVLQAAAPFGALAVEDEANQAPAVEVADLLEGHGPAPLGVAADDPASPDDRRLPGDRAQPEADLLAGPQRVWSRQQNAAAADVDGVGLDLHFVVAAVDHHRPGGADADVFAFLEHLDRAGFIDAQDARI